MTVCFTGGYIAMETGACPFNDERILKRLDDDGEVIEFLIHEMSTLNEPSR